MEDGSLWLLNMKPKEIEARTSAELTKMLSKLATFASRGAYANASFGDLELLDVQVEFIQRELASRNTRKQTDPIKIKAEAFDKDLSASTAISTADHHVDRPRNNTSQSLEKIRVARHQPEQPTAPRMVISVWPRLKF